MGPSDKEPRDQQPVEPQPADQADQWGSLDDESLLLDEDFIQRILDGDDGIEVPEEFMLEDTEALRKAVAEMLDEQDAAAEATMDVDYVEVPTMTSIDLPFDEPADGTLTGAGGKAEDEEGKSLYTRIKAMNVGQKIKLALKGGRGARNILIRDANKIIKRLVLRNPRMSEDEIGILVRNRSEETEFLEYVSHRGEWMKNYQIRLALTTNPKTPVTLSMRLVNTLLDRDLRQISKSKNVPGMICSAAKRVLVKREKKN